MLQGQESAPERVPDQLRLITETELSHEIRAMALDGADADRQPPGDLRVREALGRQQEDFPLPGGQGLVGILRARRSPPLDDLPAPTPLRDGELVRPCDVEDLGGAGLLQRIAAQDDHGLPGERLVERSLVFVEACPVLLLEPRHVPVGSHPGVAARHCLGELVVPRAQDPPHREAASLEVPFPARHDLEAALVQIPITLRNALSYRPPGLLPGPRPMDYPDSEFPALP